MSNTPFTQWLKIPAPVIRTSTHEYRFKLCQWGHKWDREETERKMIKPYGKIDKTLRGFRLMVIGKWPAAIPSAEKRLIGDSWADYSGKKAIAEIEVAHLVHYQIISTSSLIEMYVVSETDWERKRAFDYERADLEMEARLLVPSIVTVEDENT